MKARSIGDRLKELRAQLGKTQDDMARGAGVPLETYKKYENDLREPGTGALLKLATAGNVSLDWLAAGRGEPRDAGASPLARLQYHSHSLAEELKAREPRAGELRPGYVYLPLYEVRASAGGGALIDQEHVTDLLAFREDWLRQELNASPRDVALLFVQGRSMEPDLRPGDVIMIDVRDTTAEREAIYVLRMDGAILVKELQRLPGGVIRVKSKNREYDPFDRNVSDLDGSTDFAIIGRVVWACRRF